MAKKKADTPCEKCGSSSHGTGGHDQLVKLELEHAQELLERAKGTGRLSRATMQELQECLERVHKATAAN